MHSSKLTEISPSFTSHSSNNLADVAARVISEFRQNNNNEYDHIFNFNNSNPQHENNDDDGNDNDNDNDNDEEFEFAIMHENSNSSCHQHILQPQYPLFDTSLLLTVDPSLLKLVTHTVDIHRINRTKSLVVRLPLIKLFNEDRDFVSSEADDDLEGVTPGTYCVWKPKANSQEKCNSSHLSRRWKLRDILPSSQGLLGAFTTVSWSNRNLRPF